MIPDIVDDILNACIVEHDLEDLIPLKDRVEAVSERVLHPIFCALNAERAAGHISKEFEEVYDEQKAEENS